MPRIPHGSMLDERYRGYRTERYMYYVARERYMASSGAIAYGVSRDCVETNREHPDAFSPRFRPPKSLHGLLVSPTMPIEPIDDFWLHDPNKSRYPAGDLIR